MVLIILSLFVFGTAAPVLAAGGSDSGSNGGSSSGNGGASDSGSSSGNAGSSSGNGGGSSDSGYSSGNAGSSSGNGGGSSDSGYSSGNTGSSSGGGSESSGSGSGVQIQTGPGTTSEPSEVSTQEQSRDRSQVTSEPLEVPTQEQSRLQSQDQTELNNLYLQQVHDRQTQLLQDRQLSQDQLNRNVALYSIISAGNVTGRNATQFIQLAEQVNQSYLVTDQARTRIQEQSLFTRFFFGGDAAAARMLLQTTEQNQDRILLMEQDLENCDCNQTIRDQLQDQLTTLTQDQDQLQALANRTLQDRGIFGGFFR